ncbi:hypothetical protein [Pseudomonas chlororaphis]|uniref:hypothetical protein n=1 Tax=Pseudomonas chlororaphis TaxID=587753 RepID=UPI002365BEEE|nr:hypothetical protein [Pseudomonas chlororaphis]WDH22405.1 hypothetical protein PUP50_31340 [Pseudomonas chlororaphis]
MKKILYPLLAIALISIVAWRVWSPVDDLACAGQTAANGPLSRFVTDYFKQGNERAWQEDTNVFDILAEPTASSITQQPQAYYCEALGLLESPTRTQSEKVYTSILMLKLPINHYLSLMDHSHRFYKEGRIDDTVLGFVLKPRGTALNYWWLPQWRSRFNRDAPSVFPPPDIAEILSGKYWLHYPGAGF